MHGERASERYGMNIFPPSPSPSNVRERADNMVKMCASLSQRGVRFVEPHLVRDIKDALLNFLVDLAGGVDESLQQGAVITILHEWSKLLCQPLRVESSMRGAILKLAEEMGRRHDMELLLLDTCGHHGTSKHKFWER